MKEQRCHDADASTIFSARELPVNRRQSVSGSSSTHFSISSVWVGGGHALQRITVV